MPPQPLPTAELCWSCDEALIGVASSADLADLDRPIGQERPQEALEVGLSIDRHGFNLFALGPQGIGKHAMVERRVRAHAGSRPPPRDWIYLGNLADPRQPRALGLAAGRGARLQADMAQLVGDLRDALRSAFDNEEYRTRRQVIEEELKERQEQAVAAVEAEARRRQVALMRSPMGLALAPVREGRVLTPEQFQELPEAERKAVEASVTELQQSLRDALAKAPAWMKETRERLHRLNDDTARFATDFLIDQLKGAWADVEGVLDFLEEVRWDVLAHIELFLGTGEAQAGQPPRAFDDNHPLLRRYRVNLLVDNAGATAAPVVYEDDPSFDRLVGKVEYRAEMGALVTDLQMIRAGALHRANGGCLLLDARKLVSRPMAWEGLKRALASREIRIESPMQAMGVLATATLEPQPVPLDVKVVLLGERQIYYLMAQADPDFPRLFKIAADFDERVARDEATVLLHARMLAGLARADGLRDLSAGGLARAIEHAARRADNREKLSLDTDDLTDLLREADFEAGRAGSALIGRAEVEAAAEARRRRSDKAPGLLLESMRDGVVQIATGGEAVGQINGLSVFFMAGQAFGRPSRITARIRVGGGQVLDIERETRLGGPIHTKGVLVLGGFVHGRYLPDLPAAVQATLVFEQSYGGVDGDSASTAEALALLSAIAGVPLRQGLAVTGAINQHGEVQAIGGVDEKIEGFFDLCALRGLDGSQGVVIPSANIRHLMLHRRVVEAAGRGQFHVWAVDHIDQAIELFTGLPAGARGSHGRFPEGSFNREVEDRLRHLAVRRRDFGKGPSTSKRGSEAAEPGNGAPEDAPPEPRPEEEKPVGERR
ncbi:MAG TPA: AAA family ATPase [Geminicoccaceae bacterium]|nr:AAA family ATPase [Geminicoccus sp.]HMU50978.1 AAA family ATPase [Geminicoccaceae bacterium]